MDGLPTYQELLAANRRLVVENEHLLKENAKLSELVKSIVETGEEIKSKEVNSGSKDPESVFQENKLMTTSCLSLEEKVTLFSSLFKGHEDAFARIWHMPCSIECSRSGNGAHVWIFFKKPLAAIKARKLGNVILTEVMNRAGRVSLESYDRLLIS